MSDAFFPDVEKIRFKGPGSTDELAFRHYDADREIMDRRMEDHLRFAVCYWHGFCWPGNDVFGDGTFDRPWLAEGADAIAQAVIGTLVKKATAEIARAEIENKVKEAAKDEAENAAKGLLDKIGN